MKLLLFVGLALILIRQTLEAGIITNSFSGLSPQLQCNECWTNQNVVLSFGPTVASEDGADGFCSFGFGAGFAWLYPSRLRLDFALLDQPVTRIEADIADQCGKDCTKVFAYAGGALMGSAGNAAILQNETLSLTFGGVQPDSCAVRSFEAKLRQVRVFTGEAAPRLSIRLAATELTISWQTNAVGYLLERTDSLDGSAAWQNQVNAVQTEGTNFVHRHSLPAGTSFFRLRRN